MIRFIPYILSFLFLATNVYAAPPTRQATYESGSIISSSEVTSNEDAIFNYLQAGVDTYADNTIFNSDIANTANIQSDKLNLTSIAQAVLINSSGSFQVDGSSAFGAITTGVVSAIDINGGTIDGTAIGINSASTLGYTIATGIDSYISRSLDFGSTSPGSVIYDAGGALAKTNVGTSGYLLKSNGSSAPTFVKPFVEVLTSSGTWTAPSGVNYISIDMCGGGGGGGGADGATSGTGGGGGGAGECIIGHIYTVTPSSTYTVTIGASGAGGTSGAASSGSNGGDTSFVGGAYTLTASGGLGGVNGSSTGNGGAGGTGSVDLFGSASINGTSGSSGGGSTEFSYTGGTGGQGRTSSNGGGGGSGALGKGGTGGSGSGTDGGAGAGGGGAGVGNSNVAGAGGTGIIILKYYINGTPS